MSNSKSQKQYQILNSKTIIWSLFVFCTLGFGIFPKLALGKTVSFNDKVWQINPSQTKSNQTSIVRNNFDLKILSKHILLAAPINEVVNILDPATILVLEEINNELNQPSVSAKLKIENGWASEFTPDQDGIAVNNYELVENLSGPHEDVKIPVLVALPQTRLSELNSLGFNELVAVGESDFSGSSKNRIINVTVGSSKYNGLILNPGEEFGFNKYLGDIDAAHGYKPEQVIKASGIELEFGGGLCQVSTTMFRAAMRAGFPITQRRNHSFAVHYYSPQGTDATIYPGASDLKFINNFTTPVLVRTYVDAPHVYFEIYGKKDGRVVTFEGPVQYDKRANGSMKATWTRHVTLNGETTEYVAKSSYVSPALYRKVDAASTPNPQAQVTPANTPPATPAEPAPTPTIPTT